MQQASNRRTWSYSYTAERITEAEWKTELKSLSDMETYKDEMRIQGFQALRRETPTMTSEAVGRFYDAVERIISESPHDTYTEAKTRCPDLFQDSQDSDPIRFLRATDFDCEAAARRMLAYWKIRCELFGEKAFYPISQSILTKKEREVWKSGAFMLLPRDNRGRSVLYAHRDHMSHLNHIECVRTRSVLKLFF